MNNKSLNPNAPEFIPSNQLPNKFGDILTNDCNAADETVEKSIESQIKDLITLLIFTDSPTLKKIYEIMAFVSKNKNIDSFLSQMFSVVLPLSECEKKRSGDVIAILYFRIEDPEVKLNFQTHYKTILSSYYVDCVRIIDDMGDCNDRVDYLVNFLQLLSIYYTQTLYRDILAVSMLLLLLKKIFLVCDNRNVVIIYESLKITHKLTDLLIIDVEKLKSQCEVPLFDDCICPANIVEFVYKIIREKIVNRFFGNFSKECLDMAIGIIEGRARAFGRHKTFLMENNCMESC